MNKNKETTLANRYALLFLCLLGGLTRLAFLFQPIRLDELSSGFVYSSLPLSEGLSLYSRPGNHLFHTFLTHFSTGLFGSDVWAIRLPAFIAGILIIPATYWVIKELYNKKAGILAAALTTPSVYLISYSTDGRGYTIQILVFLLLVGLAVRIMRTGKTIEWVGFVLLGIIGFYTMPTTTYFFGAVVVWMGLSAICGDTQDAKWNFIKKLIGSCFVTVVVTIMLYIPVVMNSGIEGITSNMWVKSLPVSTFIKGIPGHLSETWMMWNDGMFIGITGLLLLGFFTSIIFHKQISKQRINLAVVILGWCAVLFMIQRVLPFARTWLPLLPLYIGFSSAGLWYIVSNIAIKINKSKTSPSFVYIILAVVSLFLCLFVYWLQAPYQAQIGQPPVVFFQDASQTADVLKLMLKPGDIVYTDEFAEALLEYYFTEKDIPLGYLSRCIRGSETITPESIKRVFIVEAFGEGHTTRTALENLNIDQSCIGKELGSVKFDNSNISIYKIMNQILSQSST